MSSGRGGGGRGGRGAYYREKYGNRGGSRGGSRGGQGNGYGRNEGGSSHVRSGPTESVSAGTLLWQKSRDRVRELTSHDLSLMLVQQIDGMSYPAYKNLLGCAFAFNDFVMFADYIQGDPFASPSNFRILVNPADSGFAESLYSTRLRRVALADFLLRRVSEAIDTNRLSEATGGGGWSGAKGGDIRIERPSQHILERTSVSVSADGVVECRFTVGMPARGRTALGQWADEILLDKVPALLRSTLFARVLDEEAVRQHIESAEDQDSLRTQLSAAGLAAFVCNGAILPRASGSDDRPMSDEYHPVPFESPLSLQCEFTLPNCGKVTGMGIKRGITVIVGGGFHGKSTLLVALEQGVYNHVPGDGREFVCCDPTAVKIRAEDGRACSAVDISTFINNLPRGKPTDNFSTADASGSTSQAANIMEALEVGARALLIDEDTSATNFMIRDKRMQLLVSKHKEPITPFVSRVRSLWEDLGVSTILVIGGSGDYFDVADVVLCMEDYVPSDVSDEAKQIATDNPTERLKEVEDKFGLPAARIPVGLISDITDGKIKTLDINQIQFGELIVQLNWVEQLVEVGQTRAAAELLQPAAREYFILKPAKPFSRLLDEIEEALDSHGLDAFCTQRRGNLSRPRRFEIASVLNRLRSLRARQLAQLH